VSDGRQPLGCVKLGAYVDGELDPRRRREVEAQLDRSADARARMVALQRLDRALRTGAFATTGEPRSQLAVLLGIHLARQRRRRRWLAAAVVALLVVAGGGARLADLMDRPPGDLVEMVGDAEAAFRVYPVGPAVAPGPVALDGVAANLSDRIGRHIPVPDLGRWGFRLVGDALLTTDRGPTAQLVYADSTGRRLSCLFQLRPVMADASLRYREKNGLVTAFGADEDLAYAMSGRLPRRELASIAEEVYGHDDP
jgi:anti-sigma factor RsiW